MTSNIKIVTPKDELCILVQSSPISPVHTGSTPLNTASPFAPIVRTASPDGPSAAVTIASPRSSSTICSPYVLYRLIAATAFIFMIVYHSPVINLIHQTTNENVTNPSQVSFDATMLTNEASGTTPSNQRTSTAELSGSTQQLIESDVALTFDTPATTESFLPIATVPTLINVEAPPSTPLPSPTDLNPTPVPAPPATIDEVRHPTSTSETPTTVDSMGPSIANPAPLPTVAQKTTPASIPLPSTEATEAATPVVLTEPISTAIQTPPPETTSSSAVAIATDASNPILVPPLAAVVANPPATTPTTSDPPLPSTLPSTSEVTPFLHNHCTLEQSTRTCDWSWGSGLLDFTRNFTREELGPELADGVKHRRPADFFTYGIELMQTELGPGAWVTIQMRDLCCTSALSQPIPLTYFSISAWGRAQASVPPPIALGPRPAGNTSMGFGHQLQGQGVILNADGTIRQPTIPAVHVESHPRESMQHQAASDDSLVLRKLQTFLLLPDAGHYSLEVRLLHFNVSRDMVSEFYEWRTDIFQEQRQGIWVDAPLKSESNELITHLIIPSSASPNPSVHLSNLPLCGSPEAYAAAAAAHQLRANPSDMLPILPLAGRWTLTPSWGTNLSVTEFEQVDWTSQNRLWLVEHSDWRPYYCQIDATPLDELEEQVMSRIKWLHTQGDSNGRKLIVDGLCLSAHGDLFEVDRAIIPMHLDPPYMCTRNMTGQPPGSLRWVQTFDRWHWGKPNLLIQPPGFDFSFRTQCNKWPLDRVPEQPYYGWLGCRDLPEAIQELTAPTVTYFSWGSHYPELADSDSASVKLLADDCLGLSYFSQHPTIIGLTTALSPSQIPMKFGRQQLIRNNERVLGANKRIIQMWTKKYHEELASGHLPANSWLLFLDTYSASHAAYDIVTIDAVHFIDYFYQTETRWIMHLIKHAPQFQPTQIAANN